MNTQTRYGSAVVTLPTDTEIVITRRFDAPAARLFEAWTTPELVRQWWGFPEDTWVSCDIDLRVGGTWRWVNVHHGDDGDVEVAFHGTYDRIEAPRLLAYTEVFEGAPVPDPETTASHNTLTFEEADGVTTMTLRGVSPDVFTRDAIIASGMERGMQVSMDRVEDLVRGS